MVGLTIISHKAALAKAISELIAENTQFKLCPANVSYENPENIIRAIKSVESPHGVLVLVDSAEAAAAVKRVSAGIKNMRLCPAPLWEGAHAASAIIVEGANLDEAYFCAMRTLAAKNSVVAGIPNAETVAYSSYKFQMKLLRGMHASSAAELVNVVIGFESDVFITNITRLKPPVNAKSINKIALSNIRYGDEVEIITRGEDAAAAAAAVKKLVDNNFNRIELEKDSDTDNSMPLITISMGIAVGTLYCADSFTKDIQPLCVLDPENEIHRLKDAIESARHSLYDSKSRLIERGLRDEAAIFDAHAMILSDSEIFEDVCTQIRTKRLGAEYAYQQKMLALADDFRNIDDIYMKERATDVLDVAKQVVGKLMGIQEPDMSAYRSVIIAANEVTPSMMSKISPERLKGVITNVGSAFSHVAIIARALGIPAVAGYRLPATVVNGSKIVMDASVPEIIVHPSSDLLEGFKSKYSKWVRELEQNLEYGRGPAVTIDGYEIPVMGNVGSIATSEAVLKNGAGGIGLLRTEFLYMNRRKQPSEKEQTQILRDIFTMFGSGPMVVRTIDIGGDKHIPWLPLKKENNPFLGLRGVRVYPREQALFYTQLSAILKAGMGHDIRIVVPMISMMEEVIFVRNMINKAHNDLESAGIPHVWPVQLGVMVETPAAVLMADDLAKISDFFSIGTNDLSQYIMAAERGDKNTDHLLNPMQPALLKAIKMSVDAAHRNGIEVSVCGEMAGDPEFAKILLGLGVDCLSMNAPMIGVIKRMVRENSMEGMRCLAESAVSTEIPAIFQIED